MHYIRKVYDEHVSSKKGCAIVSPREDAHMFRNIDRQTVPCECIVEMYELLWRWGHRCAEAGFAHHFRFSIPDTIVIVKGKIHAWYFVSKRDGRLLRKSEGSLLLPNVEKLLCAERAEGQSPICATWLPRASPFPEARCHSQQVEFLSVSRCRDFLKHMRPTHSGIVQAFVEPHCVSNFLVRTVHFRGQTSLCVRTNRSLLNGGSGNTFERYATFEGWEGLSSACSRYRCHKHPDMEALMLEVGETLNQRIEQQQIRHMLFLEQTQHVALHFKVANNHTLHFIFASVVSEEEVILQTRVQLLMQDQCMTKQLPCAALLPGGTGRKANAYEAPSLVKRREEQLQKRLQKEQQPHQQHQQQKQHEQHEKQEQQPEQQEGQQEDDQQERHELQETHEARRTDSKDLTIHPAHRHLTGSLPPLGALPQPEPTSGKARTSGRRPLSAQRSRRLQSSVLPRMGYAPPAMPEVPYQFSRLEHDLYEHRPPYLVGKDAVKVPLVTQRVAPLVGPPLSARLPRALSDSSDHLASGPASARTTHAARHM